MIIQKAKATPNNEFLQIGMLIKMNSKASANSGTVKINPTAVPKQYRVLLAITLNTSMCNQSFAIPNIALPTYIMQNLQQHPPNAINNYESPSINENVNTNLFQNSYSPSPSPPIQHDTSSNKQSYVRLQKYALQQIELFLGQLKLFFYWNLQRLRNVKCIIISKNQYYCQTYNQSINHPFLYIFLILNLGIINNQILMMFTFISSSCKLLTSKFRLSKN
ncbi:unnamed protein product (macronuclear) [Paramecium tetraurelia]|uniref:Transmembrane protein n=1 Tax=Paramecium tetraurelia TaxID=5888 RepID=A0DFG5_PARTE|nr:uncharacterized protein GSPATT00016595001 [Paramecium tetraurelia]CAK81782.1 unnamed protein product [Paramecium tetraurelia]|eukprot:XP_001449179.1 hypothetical protein (macronuclear) [Paramecium tetraurelia strain d4-2]